MTTGTEPSVGGFDLAGILAIGDKYREDRIAKSGKKLYESMHQVPISAPQIPITAGAGTLQIYDGLGPTTGFCWSVRMLNAQGFSAGTINVYRNISGGELLFTFPQAGTFTFGRGEMMLQPDDTMVFVAAGITTTTGFNGPQIGGRADCFIQELQPEYLM